MIKFKFFGFWCDRKMASALSRKPNVSKFIREAVAEKIAREVR